MNFELSDKFIVRATVAGVLSNKISENQLLALRTASGDTLVTYGKDVKRDNIDFLKLQANSQYGAHRINDKFYTITEQPIANLIEPLACKVAEIDDKYLTNIFCSFCKELSIDIEQNIVKSKHMYINKKAIYSKEIK